jgi:hypothetical protein
VSCRTALVVLSLQGCDSQEGKVKALCDSVQVGDTEKIIEIVYQIRNGFAHRPHAPDWRVNAARRHQYVLTVQSIRIDVDFAALNGQPMKPEHFGGIEGFLAMCKSLHDTVKALERKQRSCPCGSRQPFEMCHGQ